MSEDNTPPQETPPEKPATRTYTMSPLALAQRRAAAARSTGPVTEEGKAASSRNAWKHGEYSAANQLMLESSMVGHFGKPCRTTCPKHPDNDPEHPCSLVLDGLTKAGGDCLDKTVYVEAFEAIMEYLNSDRLESMQGILGAQTAGAIELLQQVRNEIGEHGVLIKVSIFDKDGEPVIVNGEQACKVVLNPALAQYTKLLDSLGLNLPQLLATPAARKRVANPEEANDPVADMFTRLLERGGSKGPVKRHEVIEGDFREVKPDA